jgi:hypothetical protein
MVEGAVSCDPEPQSAVFCPTGRLLRVGAAAGTFDV